MNRRTILAASVAIVLALGGCQKATRSASKSSTSPVNATQPLTLETTSSPGAPVETAQAGATAPAAPESPAATASTATSQSPIKVDFQPPAKGTPLPLAYAQASPEDSAPRIPISKVEELIGKNAAVVIDVRSPSAYGFEHAAGAINIPENELAQKLEKLPRDKMIVLYCT